MLFLDRLIGIGVRANRNGGDLVFLRRQLSFQHLGCLGPCDQPRLEIQARRQPQIGMAWPRETIDTTVFAPAIRVDRPVKRQVRRLVVADHGARNFNAHLGAQDRQRVIIARPSIGHSADGQRLEPARAVAGCAPSGQSVFALCLIHSNLLEQIRNMVKYIGPSHCFTARLSVISQQPKRRTRCRVCRKKHEAFGAYVTKRHKPARVS